MLSRNRAGLKWMAREQVQTEPDAPLVFGTWWLVFPALRAGGLVLIVKEPSRAPNGAWAKSANAKLPNTRLDPDHLSLVIPALCAGPPSLTRLTLPLPPYLCKPILNISCHQFW